MEFKEIIIEKKKVGEAIILNPTTKEDRENNKKKEIIAVHQAFL